MDKESIPSLEKPERILLVDDMEANLQVLFHTLQILGHELLLAQSGEEALETARLTEPALILLDIMMPGIDGFVTCQRLKAEALTSEIPVIFMSALDETENKVRGFTVGAVDYITKPFQAEEVLARVSTHLRLRRLKRDLRERNAQLRQFNEHLEEKVRERSQALVRSRDAVIFGLAQLAEMRDHETGLHLERICCFVEILLRELRADYPQITEEWARDVAVTAALHDIGKVAVPDAVLQKPGRLTQEERRIIQRHASAGGESLRAIKRKWGDDPFLETGTEIAASHHERWDGTGYPAGLRGEAIPLAARIVAVADVYDALTSKRVYKPKMPHEKARKIILDNAGSHFDPRIVAAFERAEAEFATIAARLGDPA